MTSQSQEPNYAPDGLEDCCEGAGVKCVTRRFVGSAAVTKRFYCAKCGRRLGSTLERINALARKMAEINLGPAGNLKHVDFSKARPSDWEAKYFQMAEAAYEHFYGRAPNYGP